LFSGYYFAPNTNSPARLIAQDQVRFGLGTYSSIPHSQIVLNKVFK
jgi:hypothetical protein